ncbi:hypothetical protein KC356_g6287 [Hortaea werneckii]|nr:hypothetical protein KC356_g6287 [Hortaea werneckii]
MASQEDEKKIRDASPFQDDGMTVQRGGEQIGEAHPGLRHNVPVPADREILEEGGGLLASPQDLQDYGDRRSHLALPSSTLSAHARTVRGAGEGGWATEDTQATASASDGAAGTGPSYTLQFGGPFPSEQAFYHPTSSLAPTYQPQATQPQTSQQPTTPLEQRLLAQLNEHSQSGDQVTSGPIDMQGHFPVMPQPLSAPTGVMDSPGIYHPFRPQQHASTRTTDDSQAERDLRDMSDEELNEYWTEYERKWDKAMEDDKYPVSMEMERESDGGSVAGGVLSVQHGVRRRWWIL